MSHSLIVVLKNFKTIVIDGDFIVIMKKKNYTYYDKKYFKNNIKITILLKRACIKNNFETIVTNYDFKDIFETFKITVINNDFLHLKKIYMNAYVNIKN